MPRHARSYLFVVLLAGSAYLTFVDLALPFPWAYFTHGAAALLLISLLYWYVATIDEHGPTKSLGPPQVPADITADQLREAMDKALTRYGEPAREFFGYTLFRLPRYLTRIDERAVPGEDGLRISTTLTFRLSDRIKTTLIDRTPEGDPETPKTQKASSDEALLLPIVRTRKGKHIDNLVVTDNTTGLQAPTLSRYETHGLVALALETLIQTEAVSPPDPDALQLLLTTICNARVDRAVEGLEATLKALQVNDNALAELVELCDYLANNYIVIAQLSPPAGRQLTVRYDRFVAVELSSYSSYQRVRARFGLAPSIIDTPPTTYAFQAQSYHMQLLAPPNQYVYAHWLERPSSSRNLIQDDVSEHGYVRVYHQDGRTNAHCYVRRPPPPAHPVTPLKRRLPPDIKSVVEVREIPPGALGATAVVATVAAIITTFFTITRIAIDGPRSGSDPTAAFNSDIPAVLLAIPAFSAILLGHWADQKRLPRSSLSAYLGLLGTLAVSFSSALLFILDANRHFASEVRIDIWGRWVMTSDWIWLLLSIFAVSQALYLLRRLRSETKYYLSLPVRPKQASEP